MKFKIGDNVRCVLPGSRYNGVTGKVIGVPDKQSSYFRVKPEVGTSYVGPMYLLAPEMELVQKFAIGDKVKVVLGPLNAGSANIGQSGVVVALPATGIGPYFRVSFDDRGYQPLFLPDELEPDREVGEDKHMNDLEKKVILYLAEDGHPDRHRALTDLLNKGIIGSGRWVDQTRTALAAYLDTNALGFCESGIAKFRAAFDIPPPKAKTKTIRVTVDIETPNHVDKLHGNNTYGAARSVVAELNNLGSLRVGLTYPFETIKVSQVEAKVL